MGQRSRILPYPRLGDIDRKQQPVKCILYTILNRPVLDLVDESRSIVVDRSGGALCLYRTTARCYDGTVVDRLFFLPSNAHTRCVMCKNKI